MNKYVVPASFEDAGAKQVCGNKLDVKQMIV
jgi:hypothetical protein